MKFIKSLSIFLFLVISLNVHANKEEQKTIKILSWADYFDPKILKKFEKENNLRIELTTYYEENMRDYLFKNKSSHNYDIVVSSQSGMLDYINLDMLEPIDKSQYNNIEYMDDTLIRYKKIYDYAVGLSYIGIGIVYRKDKIKSIPKSWKDFFNPPNEHYGKIELINSANDVLDISLIANGSNLSNYSDKDLTKAAKTSLKLNTHIANYNYPSSYEGDTIMEGISTIGMAYSFEAYKMVKKSNNIGFLYPKEGVKVWVDLIAISKGSPNKQMSQKFIDYLMIPEISAKNSESNLYTSLNKEVGNHLTDEIAKSEILYPSKQHEILVDCQKDQYIQGKKIYYFERIKGAK